ncbi:Proton-coupled amino acid transporter 4 [Hondaea fermentalgiana]|uniref:Proton-coupled amino acid transporter 4 n=1 Tax=Hondaea fermentalgiana TaxID=2315210 RepID=A0A2R5GBY2_9STRA|nr:Proton-coupled amino acid transporter 4 [Hondaea fermentalgiana]|eukprot:GBG28506.1 Proton-coupled amino acid transporter 4 [Hondaea fermentalgiana]
MSEGAGAGAGTNRLRSWSSAGRRAGNAANAGAGGEDDAAAGAAGAGTGARALLTHGQRGDAEMAEVGAAKDAVVEALIEDNTYERIIVHTPDITREIVKEMVLDKYVQDLEEGSTAAVDGEEEGRMETDTGLQRTVSHPDLGRVLYPEVAPASEINVPGGFRREFILADRTDAADGENGVEPTEIHPAVRMSFLESLMNTNSATLYAWVDDGLASDSEDEEDSDYETFGESGSESRSRYQMVFSSYNRRSLSRRNSDFQNDESTKAGNKKTLFTLFKCFVATGVLFLPNAFKSAGLVAGTITMLLIGAMSLYGILLLIATRDRVEEGIIGQPTPSTPLLSSEANAAVTDALFPRRPVAVGTYAQLGGIILGRPGKRLVETSILFSQIGFCCVYVSFSGNTLANAAAAWASESQPDETAPALPLNAYMALVVPIIIPLTLIRHLKHFAIPNLIANIFVVISLSYIFVQAVISIAGHKVETHWTCDPDDKRSACFWINPSTYSIFLGSSVYVFEGISLVIPIQNSMRRREDLPNMMLGVVTVVSILFAAFGGLNFYAYGAQTAPIVIDNLPREGKISVSALFIAVAVFMFPLMVFPAARIIEKRLFKKLRRSGYKWQKNAIRTSIVILCLAVSIGAGEKVDKLVAVIGGLFCVPLALVYPPLLYLGANAAPSFLHRAGATALLIVGSSAALLSSITAIADF